MERANNMGVASAVCLVLAVLPPYEDWKQPVNVLLMFAAFVLAFRAGRISPWWYAMCVVLVGLLVFAFYGALNTL